MTIRMFLLRVLPLASAAFIIGVLATGCASSGGYSPTVYGTVGVGGGYYGRYGGGYYSPWYGRPYPPYGMRPPGMRPPPLSGPPRPSNPIERRPSPGRMPSMGGPSRMPSIPSMPRPSMRR